MSDHVSRENDEIITVDAEIIQEHSREKILAFEKALSNSPGAFFSDSGELPLKHSFSEGAYVRELFIPKGTVLVSKIHRHSHPAFLLKGDITIVSEEGTVRMKGPLHFISKAGTKRIGYAHEDTIWVTVHPTKETDLAKIEEEVIAKSFDELDAEMLKKLKNEVNI